jgi:uncharacterized protein (UPF0335 family)
MTMINSCVLCGRRASCLDLAEHKNSSPPAHARESLEEVYMSTAAAVKQEQPATRFAKDHLKAFVERIERLEEEKKAIAGDVRDVYAEAKANGFDTRALRAIVQLRRQDAEERRAHEAVLETYMHALGML